MKKRLKLNKKEKRIYSEFVEKLMSSREAGTAISISHQQVINNVCSMVRDMASTGVLDFRSLIEKHY